MNSQSLRSSLVWPRRIGIIIIMVTFGIFGLWSVIAPLESAALAPGTVMVKGSRKSIEHLEGGIVSELLVKDGDSVEKNQLLIRLDDTQARAQLEISTAQYYALIAREARLLAERDNQPQVNYPLEMTNNNAQRAQDAMHSHNQMFVAGRNARLGELEVLSQRIEQLGEQIKGSATMKNGKVKLKKSYQEEIKDLAGLLKDGYTDKQHFRQLQRNLAVAESDVAELESNIARIEIQVGESKLQMLQLEKKFQIEVVSQLNETQLEIFALEDRIRAAQDRVNRTEIRSPVSGIVMGLSVTTIGEVVSPAENLLSLVPQTEDLIVEAQVKPIDIDRIHQGQSASIRFSSFKNATTPVIDAVIVSVSADALTNAQLGTYYYLAKVELSPKGRKELDKLVLIPGMPAEVLINTGSRTLFQYLTQPIDNAFARSLIED